MLKSRKNIVKVLTIMLFVFVFLLTNTVCAIGNLDSPIKQPEGSGVDVDDKIKNPIDMLWNTIRYILQVVAVSIFIVIGVKYMFASADQKADLKKGLMMATIGVVLVFGATLVIKFIQTVASDVMKY